ncbi:MAG: RNA pseudouridine synthase, partial [Pseudomonadota bacterium]|nr:RNA pseudouridine synthase [Pseudomonadota bacterium]
MSDTDDEMLRLIVEPAAPPATGERLDRWLARHPDILDHPSALSRSRLKALIMDGKVTDDIQKLTDPSAPVKPGQVICVTLPPPVDTTTLPEDLPLDIIHDDDDLLVINKAAGMAVHPA